MGAGASLPRKIRDQIIKANLPIQGSFSFRPMLGVNRRGDAIIQKGEVHDGPKAGKRGWVDEIGRIWIRDYAHADLPDHWDVQLPDGTDYLRVDMKGELL